MLAPQLDIYRATVAADGTLVAADAPILALQVEAGAVEGGPLLVPQLAALARLSARLGIPLSRSVVAAGALVDIDMWVRTRPEGTMVHLAIVDWRERAPRAPGDGETARDADLMAAREGWWWQIDTRMRFVMADAGHQRDFALPHPGEKLTAWFRLETDDDGDMPILRAFAERRPFEEQRATVAECGDAYILSGLPMFDVHGALIGYRGRAEPADPNAAPAQERHEAEITVLPTAPLFGRRIDRALRQPLGRIIANADTMNAQLHGPLRDDYAAYAADIAAAGRHLMGLVNDLEDLQAVDRPDFVIAAEDIELGDIARRAAGLLSVKAGDRQIRLSTPEEGEDIPATGEFRRVLQILVNLIGNAIRYAPMGSLVTVQAERANGRACVRVEDQGAGISLEDREKIFEKFERLGRDDAQGSGLGLYISRRLARAMGGDLTVEDASGGGACFVLELPAG